LIELNYFAGSAGSIPGAEFAKKLIDKMPGLSRVYYSNSGSEANEKGYKIVRQIAHKHHGGKKHKITTVARSIKFFIVTGIITAQPLLL